MNKSSNSQLRHLLAVLLVSLAGFCASLPGEHQAARSRDEANSRAVPAASAAPGDHAVRLFRTTAEKLERCLQHIAQSRTAQFVGDHDLEDGGLVLRFAPIDNRICDLCDRARHRRSGVQLA